MDFIEFMFTDIAVRIRLAVDQRSADLLRSNFAGFPAPANADGPWLEVSVTENERGFDIAGGPQDLQVGGVDQSTLVHEVEGLLVPGYQILRPDLLFVHSAVLECPGGCIMISGKSGGGKSTLTWALTHHGCRYLSDELAPLSVGSDSVTTEPYLHSLNLKRCPGQPYEIPTGTPYTGWTWHLPLTALKGGHRRETACIDALFFITAQSPGGDPAVRPLNPAEAALHLYPNVLNALAHPGQGLPAVSRVAQQLPAWELTTGDLRTTSETVLQLLEAA